MEATNVIDGSIPVSEPKKKRKLKNIFKVISYIFLIIFFSSLAFYLIYLSSGSNRWELVIDRDGTKIYSLKVPGTSAKKYRGEAHYDDATLNDMVALVSYDNTLENCLKWIPTCTGIETVEEWDPEKMRSINLWQFDSAPFSPRELVVQTQVDQNPETLEVFLDVLAVPSKVPFNDCCIRISHMHNTWRYTPHQDGGIDAVYTQNISFGGMFPDFLMNFSGAELTYQLLHEKIPELLQDPKYQGIEYRNIRELGE